MVNTLVQPVVEIGISIDMNMPIQNVLLPTVILLAAPPLATKTPEVTAVVMLSVIAPVL